MWGCDKRIRHRHDPPCFRTDPKAQVTAAWSSFGTGSHRTDVNPGAASGGLGDAGVQAPWAWGAGKASGGRPATARDLETLYERMWARAKAGESIQAGTAGFAPPARSDRPASAQTWST